MWKSVMLLLCTLPAAGSDWNISVLHFTRYRPCLPEGGRGGGKPAATIGKESLYFSRDCRKERYEM